MRSIFCIVAGAYGSSRVADQAPELPSVDERSSGGASDLLTAHKLRGDTSKPIIKVLAEDPESEDERIANKPIARERIPVDVGESAGPPIISIDAPRPGRQPQLLTQTPQTTSSDEQPSSDTPKATVSRYEPVRVASSLSMSGSSDGSDSASSISVRVQGAPGLPKPRKI